MGARLVYTDQKSLVLSQTFNVLFENCLFPQVAAQAVYSTAVLHLSQILQ